MANSLVRENEVEIVPEPRSRSMEGVAFGRYQLLGQIGAGRDGVCYRALDPSAAGPLELIALCDPGEGESRLRERTKRLRQAALLEHPSARRVRDLRLENGPAFIVLDGVEALPSPAPGSWHDAVATACRLAAGLAEAHRFGLAHGRLEPGALTFQGNNQPRLDWTDLEVKAGSEPVRQPLYLAPERRRGEGPSAAADVFALGMLLSVWTSSVRTSDFPGSELDDDPELEPLLDDVLDDDPFARPPALQVAARLAALLNVGTMPHVNGSLASHAPPTLAEDAEDSLGSLPSLPGPVRTRERDRLGRFLLREKLGVGGMGTVYRGEDVSDGAVVAVKVLRDEWAKRPEAMQRLLKEARLLAEANNPFVTNLIEVNEDDGVHYLVLEYVAGVSLAEWIARRGRIPESIALAIIVDVARGLAVAHERGIIHRDIKPANILLVEADGVAGRSGAARGEEAEFPESLMGKAIAESNAPLPPSEASGRSAPQLPRSVARDQAEAAARVKLSDFGLARHVEETESLNLTQAGAILGTPLYMAPEQCSGTEALTTAADVYSLGAVLFHLLAGRPPFEGSSTLALIGKHQSEPPPPLKGLVESLSDGAVQVTSKALAKRPLERYADAGEMLLDLERLLRGEPTGLGIHPRLPECNPRDLIRFDFQWELEASPRQLWPHVSNTERLNRALGLPAASFRADFDPIDGVKRFAQFRTSGMQIGWREHPYEWVEGRRMGVLREFSQGPFLWFVSTVELIPRADGGTTLTHGIRVAAKGLLGRAVAHVKLGNHGKRSMDQVYRRIDAALTGKFGDDSLTDPFEPPPALPERRRQRLNQWLDGLGRHGIASLAIERLGDFLAQAPPQEVARIRPLALARRLGLDADQVVAACLHGAKDGALIMLWDLLCPVCRIPSQVVDTLRALRDHGHCEACHLDYDLDFAHSVELIFRAHPELRETELGTFCIGGPSHSPHVAAQVRVGPGERVVLDLALAEGVYRLRGPQLGFTWAFQVEPGAPIRRANLSLGHGPDLDAPRLLRAGEQHLVLTNETGHELLVRIERTAPRDDAFTAARASALPLFRDLFPGEMLSPGQVVNLSTVTLLVTELAESGDLYEELGDARAFALVHEHFRLLDECVRRHGGTLIKTINEGSVSVFTDPVAALEAALAAPALAQGTESHSLRLRAGIHRGPAMVATLNNHLDYFGAVVNVAMRLPPLAASGEVILTQAVAADPGVAALLQGRSYTLALVRSSLPGLPEGFVHRLRGSESSSS